MSSVSNGRSKVPVAITLIGIALACVILAALASDWVPTTNAQAKGYDPRPGGRAKGGRRDVESEIAALRSEVRRVEAKQAVIASRPLTENATLDQEHRDQEDYSADAVEEPRPPELDEVSTQVAVQAQVDLLTETWSSERPDPEWSTSASAALNDTYVGEEFTGMEARADCRSSLCKVALAFESSDAFVRTKLLALRSPWKGKSFFRVDTDTREGVFFVARENFDLPVPQAPSKQ